MARNIIFSLRMAALGSVALLNGAFVEAPHASAQLAQNQQMMEAAKKMLDEEGKPAPQKADVGEPPAPAAAPAKADSAPATPAQQPFYESMKRPGSVLFGQDSLTQYYNAMGTTSGAAAASGAQGGLATGRITGEGVMENAPPPEKPIQKPTYYLGSVLYVTPESWSIWLNGKRIRSSQPEPEEALKILSVRPRKVEFAWLSPDLDQVFPHWQEHFAPVPKGEMEGIAKNIAPPTTPEEKQLEERRREDVFRGGAYSWDYKSPDGKILVDSTDGIVKFTLGLHQTFITSGMNAVEGQSGAVASDTAKSSSTAPTPAGQQASTPMPATQSGATKPSTPSPTTSLLSTPGKKESFDDILNQIDSKP